jgi:hypothetical protein
MTYPAQRMAASQLVGGVWFDCRQAVGVAGIANGLSAGNVRRPVPVLLPMKKS